MKAVKAIAVNAALIVASILVGLVLVEGVLRLVGYTPHYIYWKFDPVLGWDHEPGHEGLFSTAHFTTHVKINTRGLRAREYPYDRTEGKQRILVLGDSYVWGFGVEIHESLTERLEAQLVDVEVINGAVSGYSTDQELLWFEREGVRYRPDLVIVVVTSNDPGGNTRPITDMGYFKPLFILDGNNTLRLSNVPLPEPSRVHVLARYLARKSSLVSELRYFILRNTEFRVQRYMPLGDRPAPRPEELHDPQYAIRLTVALLDRIRAVAEAHGSRVLVVVSDVPSDSPYHELVPQLARAGIEVFEVNESTGFSPAYMLITHDGHWNAAGHAFVADKLAGLLKEKGFSP